MQEQIGIRPRDVVLQRQFILDTAVAGLDDAVVINRAADTACTAQHTLAKNIGDGVFGIGFSAQGPAKLL